MSFLKKFLRRFFPAVVTRRKRESNNDFALLRLRLERENELHALMLSQRYFRRNKSCL